jgi:hypothetical protein
MFTIIYNKQDGKVLNITTHNDSAELRKALPSSSDFIFVDKLPAYDVWRQQLTVENGALIVTNKPLTAAQEQEITNILAQQEIDALKFELKETDYYTLKYIEGVISEETFKEKAAYRQALRQRIEELEKQIVPVIAL